MQKTARIFTVFLKLGCTSFGGPIAHLGYFQREFVARRKWLDPQSFADLIALCQLLPGPMSSQIGIAIGWKQGGWKGSLAAWLGFTLPSALLMTAFAYGVDAAGSLAHAGWVHGLKIAAVAIVAQALVLMARRLCPDFPRAAIAVAAAAVLVVFSASWAQAAVIFAGALAGAALSRWFALTPAVPTASLRKSSRRSGVVCLALYLGLLGALPILARLRPAASLRAANAFYRAGALVFGGGHVVLPLLQQMTVARGWLDQDHFLAGYGAAQALPGPLFAFSAYLGAIGLPGGWPGAILALVAIYVPAFLVLFAALPYWEALRAAPTARRLLAGANAAVVGLLASILYHPLWTSTITGGKSLAVALAAFIGLQFLRAPPWLIVLGCAASGFWLG